MNSCQLRMSTRVSSGAAFRVCQWKAGSWRRQLWRPKWIQVRQRQGQTPAHTGHCLEENPPDQCLGAAKERESKPRGWRKSCMVVQTPALVQDPVCSASGSLVSVSTVISSRNYFQIFPQVYPWLNFLRLSGVTSSNTSSATPSRPHR